MTGTLIHCDEALRRIESISDPVTRNLVNMAFVHFVKSAHLEKRESPSSDVDMPFLVRMLESFLAEHEVLFRTLEGEKVGAWFEDEQISSRQNVNGSIADLCPEQ